MIEPATFNTLRQFRARVYEHFDARRDALFELLDAATVAGLVPSLVYLSLAAVHRRGWGSLYDALAAGRLDAAGLCELLAGYPLDDGQPIYAVDTSVWPRDDAEASPGRGHYFSPSRQSAGQPIVTGWSYSWLAQLSLTHDSWTAPLDVQRVPAGGNAQAVAAAQIGELVEHSPIDGPVPLCVFDAGYDRPSLACELAELDGQRIAVLVRLRSDRCFYADPVLAPGPKVGRPRKHGQKFACADAGTWWAPTDQHTEEHAQ
jgi:DDE superfamily endonuclease